MRILVTGSRTWTDVAELRTALDRAAKPIVLRDPNATVTLVHGACPSGADALAAEVAVEWGWRIEPHPADWRGAGKAAGFVRNAEMVALGADICLAFAMRCGAAPCAELTPHTTHGTVHCATVAHEAGIPVTWVCGS